MRIADCNEYIVVGFITKESAIAQYSLVRTENTVLIFPCSEELKYLRILNVALLQ